MNNPGNKMSRSEVLVDAGGWLIVAGLVLEMVLAFIFHSNEPWYEQWSGVLATSLIAIGVYLEIHFGGHVRAEANAREAEANAKAEAEKTERLKLQAALAPRYLTDEQQSGISNGLRAHAGKTAHVITYVDVEAANIGLQIHACLKAAGVLALVQPGGMVPLGGFAAGIHVAGPDSAFVDGIVKVLTDIGGLDIVKDSRAFNVAGMRSGIALQSLDAAAASILVGLKHTQPLR